MPTRPTRAFSIDSSPAPLYTSWPTWAARTLVVFAVIALSLMGTWQAVWAGANEGGVLIIHTDPNIPYTTGGDFCELFALQECTDATTNLPASSTPSVWWAAAAFPEGSNPRMLGVVFGITYDAALVTISDFQMCGDFELSDPNWPLPFSGTAMTWNTVRTDLLTPVYWFAGYSYYSQDTVFSLRGHPTQGGAFADDSLPAELDPIADFGSLGFNNDPGDLPCPVPLPGGSCCLSQCECVILPEADCLAAGGTYVGDPECSLDTCGCPPSACCFDDGSCEVLLDSECMAAGGETHPDEACAPNPCPDAITGRCCLGEDLCSELTGVDCASAGGIYGGDGTACRSGSCPGDCDPVPRPELDTSGAGNGPNVGGVLILHHAADVELTTGEFDYCGESSLGDCESAVTRTDEDEFSLLYVFAAFPSTTDPDVAGVGFGVFYPTCISVDNWGHCGSIDLIRGNFPDSGTGYSVGWDTPQTERFFEVAWLIVSADSGLSGDFALGDNQEGDGVFFSSDVPSQTTPVADFGVFGFRKDGYLPCPQPAEACCFSDGTCQVLDRELCEELGGNPVAGATCQPNPCIPTPTIETSWGSIKKQFGFIGQ